MSRFRGAGQFGRPVYKFLIVHGSPLEILCEPTGPGMQKYTAFPILGAYGGVLHTLKAEGSPIEDQEVWEFGVQDSLE